MQVLTDEGIPQLAELSWTHLLDKVVAGLYSQARFMLHAEVCPPAPQKGHARPILTLHVSKYGH